MNDKAFATSVISILVSIGVLIIAFGPNDTRSLPKCRKVGCHLEQTSDSNYCFYHKLIRGLTSSKSTTSTTETRSKNTDGTGSYGNSSAHSSTSSARSTRSSSYKNSSGGSYSRGSTSSSSTQSTSYRSYDDGYEAVYDDDDYDQDRYDSDSDYADGVDDAMDELDW